MEQITEALIAKICKHHGFEYCVGSYVVFIKTAKAKWRIYHNGYQVEKLLHENYMPRYIPTCKRTKNANSGFHEQKLLGRSLQHVCDYIALHDSIGSGYKGKPQSHLERLFKHLARERKAS